MEIRYQASILLLFVVLLFAQCSKKVNTALLSSASDVEAIVTTRAERKIPCNCQEINNYIPDGRFEVLNDIKTIRLNFHFPNDSKKSQNYTGEDAIKYAKDLTHYGNERLKDNKQMNLPKGNDTPVFDPGYRYVLSKDNTTPSGLAVYEFVDDDNYFYIKKGKDKNNYDKTIVRNEAVHKDSILNVFAMVCHPDSARKTGGIALGTSIKVGGIKKDPLNKVWKIAGLFNHEIGHVLGLNHAWYKNDGCEDTPPHPNCWNYTDSGKCADNVSNNVMDYNAFQSAMTPCQIGKVHKNFYRRNSRSRGLLVKDWCDYNPEKSLIIDKEVNIDRSFDMKGDIIIRDGGTLRLSCNIHIPSGARIIVHPKATLKLNGCTLYNDCGEQWGGIEIMESGKDVGTVEYYGNVVIEDLEEMQ